MIVIFLPKGVSLDSVTDFIALSLAARFPREDIVSLHDLQLPEIQRKLGKTKNIIFIDGHGEEGYLVSAIGSEKLPAISDGSSPSVKNVISAGLLNVIENLESIQIIVCAGADKATLPSLPITHPPVSIMDGVREGLSAINGNYISIKAFSCYATIISPDSSKPIITIKNDKDGSPFKLQNKHITGVQKAFDLYLASNGLSTGTFRQKANALLGCKEVTKFYSDFTFDLHSHGLVIKKPERMVLTGLLLHNDEYISIMKQIDKLLLQLENWIVEQNNSSVEHKSYPADISPTELKMEIDKIKIEINKLYQQVSELWQNGVETWDEREFHKPFEEAYLIFIKLQNKIADYDHIMNPPSYMKEDKAIFNIELLEDIANFIPKVRDIRLCVAEYTVQQELKNLRIRPGKDPTQDPSIIRINREFNEFLNMYKKLQEDYQNASKWYSENFSTSSPTLENKKQALKLQLKADFIELEIEYILMQLQTSRYDVESHGIPKLRGEVKELRSKAEAINSKENINILFHQAILEGNIVNAKEYLMKGADVNYQNLEGDTALHIAVDKKNPATLKFLLESGANVNINNDMLTTAQECLNSLISKTTSPDSLLEQCKDVLDRFTKSDSYTI